MNINGGCRLRTHILSTFLYLFCHIGYFGRCVKEVAYSELGYTVDVEEVIGVYLENDEVSS